MIKANICEFYEEKKESILEIAKRTLKGNTWEKLDFPSLVNLLDFVLEENDHDDDIIKEFHEILTKMIGDKKGKLSPLSIPFLIYPMKGMFTDLRALKSIMITVDLIIL